MTACIALVAVCLIVSLSILTLQVKAQEPLNLTIKPDGSVEPITSLLERNGTTYTFKDDIFGTIWVQTNNIIIDGAGHSLQGQNTVNVRGVNLVGPDQSMPDCRGVLVKNLKISGFYDGIYMIGSSNNSIIGNFLNGVGVHIIGGVNVTGDLIEHNIFNQSILFIDYNRLPLDVVTENSFVNGGIYLGLSDAPTVDRNYWNNYTAQYPNAKEVDASGIWDTPYVYGIFQGVNSSVDSQPLINPVTNFEIPNFNLLLPSATPTSTQHPTINTGAEPPKTEPFPTMIVASVSLVVVLAVAAGLFICFKKHKRQDSFFFI